MTETQYETITIPWQEWAADPSNESLIFTLNAAVQVARTQGYAIVLSAHLTPTLQAEIDPRPKNIVAFYPSSSFKLRSTHYGIEFFLKRPYEREQKVGDYLPPGNINSISARKRVHSK